MLLHTIWVPFQLQNVQKELTLSPSAVLTVVVLPQKLEQDQHQDLHQEVELHLLLVQWLDLVPQEN